MNRDKNRVKTLDKAFQIIESIARNNGRARLTMLKQQLGLPTSTLHRMISTLVDLGYLDQDAATGEYELGLNFLHLSAIVLEKLDLRQIALPHLEALRNQVQETTNLVVIDSSEVLYIAKAESGSSVRVFSRIGRRAPIHATGAGKVLACGMPWSDVITMLDQKGMARLTANTIVDINEYMEELHKVRYSGYALDNEECESGAICIAVPVYNHANQVVAALSISGPKDRMTNTKIEQTIPIAIESAHLISNELGWKGQAMNVSANLPTEEVGD